MAAELWLQMNQGAWSFNRGLMLGWETPRHGPWERTLLVLKNIPTTDLHHGSTLIGGFHVIKKGAHLMTFCYGHPCSNLEKKGEEDFFHPFHTQHLEGSVKDKKENDSQHLLNVCFMPRTCSSCVSSSTHAYGPQCPSECKPLKSLLILIVGKSVRDATLLFFKLFSLVYKTCLFQTIQNYQEGNSKC